MIVLVFLIQETLITTIWATDGSIDSWKYPVRMALAVIAFALTGAATAAATLALEPRHKIRVALWSALFWSAVLFLAIFAYNWLMWAGQDNRTLLGFLKNAFVLTAITSSGGLLVLFGYNKHIRNKKKSQ